MKQSQACGVSCYCGNAACRQNVQDLAGHQAVGLAAAAKQDKASHSEFALIATDGPCGPGFRREDRGAPRRQEASARGEGEAGGSFADCNPGVDKAEGRGPSERHFLADGPQGNDREA